jgi:beta-1,4-mannosyltransferase
MGAVIFTLSDWDYSPRMRNWLSWLEDGGYKVKICSYSNLKADCEDSYKIRELPSLPVPRTVGLFIRAIYSLLSTLPIIWWCLWSDLVITSVPPISPILPFCILAGVVNRRLKIVMDWHNLPSSILEFSSKQKSTVFRLFETWIPRFGIFLLGNRFINVAVTKSLADHIRGSGSSNCLVIKDRPLSFTEKASKYGIPSLSIDADARVFKIVTSTSYSPEEPFDDILNALNIIDDASPREIALIVTGKSNNGKEASLKKRYQAMSLKNSRLYQTWLDSREEYEDLLRTCDLGLSLHKSTSGLDFPMKIIDMKSVSLPVCSTLYQETCDNDYVDFTYSDATELAEIIKKHMSKLLPCKKTVDTLWQDEADQLWDYL